ncbi:MAG: hypothetical protein D6791_17045 [Chloroflexi bacterium]|nr:MAG: hypothetical protein D6791_17045 [Chloroflexota bacterium]
MKTDFATVLDECLDRLKAGDSISACLERYPEHAEELEPLLETAQLTAPLRFTEPPRPQALARGRQRFLTEAARLRAQQQARERPLVDRLRDFFTAGLTRPVWGRAAVAIVVVLLLFGAVSGVVVQAAASSLPGDPLYSVKQVTRQVQLLTALSPQAREQKQKQIQAQEREEVRQATEQGRVFEEDVAGVIIGWNGRVLVLEGNLQILVTDATQLKGRPVLGHIAQVHVRSQNGQLLAQAVETRPEAVVMIVPTNTATATPMPTATLKPTATPRPTNTPEPTKRPTKKVVPTNTPTPKPKETETPFPTATAELGPSVHIFELRGTIDFLSESMWVVAGQEIQISSDTIIKGAPAVGRIAHVRANRYQDGTFVAVEIEVEQVNTPAPQKVFVSGVVESKESETIWYVNGRRIRTDDRTRIVGGELRVGAFVDIEGVRESSTTVFAHKITIVRVCETPALLEGTIVAIDNGAGRWVIEVMTVVDGQPVPVQFTIILESDTEIQNMPVVGAVAQIEACRTGEHTYVAQRIFVVPTPVPTDTPTVTPVPTDTPTATPAPTNTPTATPAPIDTPVIPPTSEPPSLKSTPTVGSAPTVTPSPEATETPAPTDEPSPTGTSTTPSDVTPSPTP